MNNVIDFLTFLFHERNLSYSAINSARSALSSFLEHTPGVSIGQHPLIVRFLKGVFQQRPALPKNIVVWDVNIVLKFVMQWYPLDRVGLKETTLKCVTLLALLSAQRRHSLSLIDIRNLTISSDECKIRFGDLLKQTRPGTQQKEICLPAYSEKSLCIVDTLNSYLSKTENLRQSVTQLFICFIKPHKAASVDTISRWIRLVLKMAGIDMNIFTPHSTRAAAVSAARKSKIPICTILDTAGWSSCKTYAKFYDKPIDSNHFSESLQDRAAN